LGLIFGEALLSSWFLLGAWRGWVGVWWTVVDGWDLLCGLVDRSLEDAQHGGLSVIGSLIVIREYIYML